MTTGKLKVSVDEFDKFINKEINMNKKLIVIAVILVAVSFGAGFFAKPAKVKTEIKEVVKTVTVTQEAKTKYKYKYKVVKPDGTVIEVETEQEATNVSQTNTNETKKEVSKEVVRDSGLTLSALAIANTNDIAGHREYGIHVTKRVFSNITIGAMATTDKKVGLSVGLSF